MRNIMKTTTALVLIALLLIAPSLALTDYQRGVLDGLNRGWFMAQKYDKAQTGSPTEYNEAVPKYNAWIISIFGKNDSLMLTPISIASQEKPYSISKTFKPVHAIDASWNQSLSYVPQPDASGLINGVPAETYYSMGPALINF
jgi:hypothetical protein